MEFIITDRDGIEKGVLVKSSYVVISIHDPDKRPPRIRKQPGFRASLVLAFDDAEEVPAMALPREIVLMSRDQAKKIRRFIEKHREDVGAVVVHCEAAYHAARESRQHSVALSARMINFSGRNISQIGMSTAWCSMYSPAASNVITRPHKCQPADNDAREGGGGDEERSKEPSDGDGEIQFHDCF